MRRSTPCECLECGRLMHKHARQLCSKCWSAHSLAGTLHMFAVWPDTMARYEDFLMVRKHQPELTQKQIAQRVGVTERHIARFEAHRVGRRIIKSLERNNK